ncbi:MAG: SGNH/GDSL hydrolase family protein [Bdellovibrionaceae bacterium]|nr:SGNH/GDSL hydrolase family protein [Pseudobdellovibrionaceae bacterium]
MRTILVFFLLAFFSIQFAFSQTRYQRIVVFGDSLSDVGTYAKTAGILRGGKFTTNPGKIWIEYVAQAMNLPMKPNRQEGLAYPTNIIGGSNYAQGGARIRLERGQTELEVEKLGITARPLYTQVQFFLQQNKRFQPMDLVFVQGGANDVFAQLSDVRNQRISADTAIHNIAVAANQMNELILTLRKYGASNIVVLNLPYIQKTPLVLGQSSQMQALVEKLVMTFNAQLATGARALGARYIDLSQFEMKITKNYTQYGFKNITQPACSLRFLPGNSALYCSPKNYVEQNANRTYKYADLIHPTTGFSELIGKFIISELSSQRVFSGRPLSRN